MNQETKLDLLRFCYSSGRNLSQDFIAKYCGFKNVIAMRAFLQIVNCTRSDLGYVNPLHAEVTELYSLGIKPLEIAKILQKPKETIYYILRKYNLPRRKYTKK